MAADCMPDGPVLLSDVGSAQSKEGLAMCYEESFLLRRLRQRAQRRETSEHVVERPAPKQPARPAPVPTGAAGAPKRKETERELEVV